MCWSAAVRQSRVSGSGHFHFQPSAQHYSRGQPQLAAAPDAVKTSFMAPALKEHKHKAPQLLGVRRSSFVRRLIATPRAASGRRDERVETCI